MLQRYYHLQLRHVSVIAVEEDGRLEAIASCIEDGVSSSGRRADHYGSVVVTTTDHCADHY